MFLGPHCDLGVGNEDLVQGEEMCFRIWAPNFRVTASGNMGSRKNTELRVRKSEFRSAFVAS